MRSSRVSVFAMNDARCMVKERRRAGGYLGTMQFMFILMLVIPPANLSLACEEVLLELMDMQREASLDPKRTEEAVQISHIIGYYERCSPVS